MIDIYCDESHDGHVYALAGWIATPSGWDLFSPAWRAMLGRHPMPDGAPMPCFHAAEIVGRDLISDSRWKGWTFEQEKAAFVDAVDQIADRRLCSIMWSVGCSVSLPLDSGFFANKDAVWYMLFIRLFHALFDAFPAQNGFSFMFDDKPEVMEPVAKFYALAKALFDEHLPGKMAQSTIAFGSDEDGVLASGTGVFGAASTRFRPPHVRSAQLGELLEWPRAVAELLGRHTQLVERRSLAAP